MKNGALFREETLDDLSPALSWKALPEFVIDHFEETKKGIVEGWNFDK